MSETYSSENSATLFWGPPKCTRQKNRRPKSSPEILATKKRSQKSSAKHVGEIVAQIRGDKNRSQKLSANIVGKIVARSASAKAGRSP